MKRIHVGLKVSDIEKAVIFYTRLFGMKPSLLRSDYAKWMLDDPLLNFSVDIHGEGLVGAAHFGVQVNGNEELEKERVRIDEVGLSREDQNNLICGYQLQHKSWVEDPDGLMWETFFTEGVVEGSDYGNEEVP